MCATEAVEDVIGVEQQELRDLYSMFADLDRQGNVQKSVYQELRNLPIWLSGRGLIKADPGAPARQLHRSHRTGRAS